MMLFDFSASRADDHGAMVVGIRRVILVACVLLMGLSVVLPREAAALMSPAVECEERCPFDGKDTEGLALHASARARGQRASRCPSAVRPALLAHVSHLPAGNSPRPRPVPPRAAGPAPAAISLLN